MSANRVCWSRSAVDFATQVDVGGLEADDPHADAVFRAIHQSLPVSQESGGGRTPVSEEDVLRAFTRPITSNEPLLLFVTGEKGTGKSHLVRWLKSRLESRPSWHVVYIEKRNTSLRRVTERILAGIDTPRARALSQELERASSEITSDEEAMSALLARLDQLVTFDQATEIGSLPDVSAAELADLRRQAHRLLGDFTFRRELSAPGGPVHRIVGLARGGREPSEDVDDADLHLTEADLRIDPSGFEDLGQELQNLIASLVANRGMRADIAALCDWYLPRAKAQVFIGHGTNLLDVFEDVREEIARRGEELCLLIEDLVLLHGIDRQLAQALTIPASARLCRLRAAIAVTSGYLSSLDTFTDRGLRFTLDMNLDAIGQAGLRDFIARYLNAGRLSAASLATAGDDTPNACITCPDLGPCHDIFGSSRDRYGLYPFNGTAVDRLIAKASPGEFRPREILRQVIRACLEVAEKELPVGATFPSERFARTLDHTRSQLDPTVREAIRRLNTVSPEAEISLRAFYALSPPAADPGVEEIARYLGDQLTDGMADGTEDPGGQPEPRPQPGPRRSDEVRRWTDDNKFLLSAQTANTVRKWICETVVAQLQNGPYGVAARKVKGKNEWRIGSHTLRLTDVRIERAHGGGAAERPNPFRITATDANAALIRGVLAVAGGDSLDAVGGEWFFGLQTRMSDYASVLAGLATAADRTTLPSAVEALTVLRHVSAEPGQTVRDALTPMLAPVPPEPLNPAVGKFVRDVQALRDEALVALRDHATAAKGTGNPSLLDTGLLYGDIRSHLSARSVSGSPGSLLGRLQVMQSRASKQAWADVTAAFRAAARVLDPGEDLSGTLTIVDRLVSMGLAAGKLPRADFRATYDEARARLAPESMETYRQLAKKLANEPGPEDIWDICDDPLPRLEALTRYATVTNELLDGIASKIAQPPNGGPFDTGALIKEFRELADLLDDVARFGRPLMAATETLIDRAEAMLNRLAQAQADAASQQARSEIEAARARASRIAADLCAAKDAVPALDECGVALGPAIQATLLQEAARARTVLRTAATSMVGAQPDEVASRAGSHFVDTALAAADRLARSVLTGLNRSVERWRQEILPAGIGERIVAYPGTSDALVVRLGNIQRRLQQSVENLAAGQLAERARQIKSDAAVWAQERPRLDTGLEGRHPDVQEFLRQAATDEGASWHLITTAVADWLDNPENTASLRVVLRS